LGCGISAGLLIETQTIIRFGVFEADFRSGELRRSGVRVKIQDLPFRALKLLLDHPNQVVTRESFRQTLWPEDVFVDFDRGISSAVKRLRDALGDSADNPIFIETVERRGYRWIAPTSVISTAPAVAVPESTDRQLSASAATGNSLSSPPQIPSQSVPRFSVWKLVYLLPILVFLFAIWTFHPGSRTANASLHQLHPANQQAKDLYLQGRYYWSKRTPDDLHKAVDYFTQAIVQDPGYADAYVGLADCYNLLPEYTAAMRAGEAYPRARAAAAKAVELDENSSQAHASLAFALFWGFWDATNSDREFRRAVELDPNNAIAHHWYATTLQDLGRFPQALAQIESAQALDPTSRSILADKATILYQIGRQKEALDLLQQMEKADPAFLSPHRYLKFMYVVSGDYRDYLIELRQEAILANDATALEVADAAAKGFADSGAKGMFEALRVKQLALLEQGKIDPYLLAETCARAGDKADALNYLKAAYDQHSHDLPGMGIDHSFDGLRNEPAFNEIKAAMKLPYAQATVGQ
jgi:DNA-binding winged helix-turn-helix (wHTH) protein/Tfp pilus assembly protein PilF